jgi:hypothetical protein
MVSEWEKEELGRLTHQKMQSLSAQREEREREAGIQPGKMTLQNLQCMKSVQKQSETKEAKIKQLLNRMTMAVNSTFAGLFSSTSRRTKDDRCKVYGHNFPFGTQWKGEFPRCLDCNDIIKDPNTLRGSLPMEERTKFKSVGER